MKLKHFVAGVALLSSPAAFAGATANVGAFSEYMFRGIAQTGGAAVQGGLDYAHDSGLYVGTWASNIGFGGGTEQDFYGGFSGKVGGLGFDVGALYYWYPEEDESASELSTLEFYGGLILGPVTVKYYYSDEANFFIGDGAAQEASYLTGSLALPLTKSLNFTANLGYYSGDEIERFLDALAGSPQGEDEYFDYGVGLAKSIDGGYTATFQYIATDIDATGADDDPKFVVGLKKSFDL